MRSCRSSLRSSYRTYGYKDYLSILRLSCLRASILPFSVFSLISFSSSLTAGSTTSARIISSIWSILSARRPKKSESAWSTPARITIGILKNKFIIHCSVNIKFLMWIPIKKPYNNPFPRDQSLRSFPVKWAVSCIKSCTHCDTFQCA